MPAVLTPKSILNPLPINQTEPETPQGTPGHRTETPRDPRHHTETSRGHLGIRDPRGTLGIAQRFPGDPQASHSHPKELYPWPGQDLAPAPTPVQDAAEGCCGRMGGDGGGHGKSQLPEPGGYKYPSLSEKGPEVELFRSGSKSRRGKNKWGLCLAGRTLPQTPTAPAGIAKEGVERGVHPQNGCSHTDPKERQQFCCKSTRRHAQNSPTHEEPWPEHNPVSATGESPRQRGGQLAATPRQGQVLPELSRGGRWVPDPTAPANRKSPFLYPCAGDAGWVQSPRQPAGTSCLQRGGAGPAAAGCQGRQLPKMGC